MEHPPHVPLPPERPRPTGARRRRLGCLLVLVGLSVCVGGLQGILYWGLPPYTWKGWVDDEHRTPPTWRVEAPRDNAREVYEAVIPLLPTGESETAVLDEAESNTTRVEAIVAAHRGVLEKLREGADKRYFSGKPLAPETPLPELARYRAAARLACAAARAQHARGEDDEALRTLADVTALGVNLHSGEAPTQMLVGASCVAMAHRPAATVILCGSPSDAALRAHASRMRALRLRLPGLAGSFACQAAYVDVLLDRFEQGDVTWLLPEGGARAGVPTAPADSSEGGGRHGGWNRSEARLALARAKLSDTRAWLHDHYARLIEEVDKPVAVSRFEELASRSETDAVARRDLLAQMLGAIYAGIVPKYRSMVAQLAAEEIMCALELYRREDGGYPAKLADLAPAYLPDVPVDPFTDGPIVYRVTPTGYTLYALGPNRVDDGGVSVRPGQYEPDQVFVTGAPPAEATQ